MTEAPPPFDWDSFEQDHPEFSIGMAQARMSFRRFLAGVVAGWFVALVIGLVAGHYLWP